MVYAPYEDEPKQVRYVELPNYELIEKSLNMTVKNIIASKPYLFAVKGSGADFKEQNKSTVFDWPYIKSEKLREKSAVFT